MKNALAKMTAVLAATGAVVAGVGPAQAVHLVPSPAELQSASLQLSDVPPSFSDDPKWESSYTGPGDTRRYEMCVDKDGHKVFGTPPQQHENATVALDQTGSGENITAAKVVSSDIYAYRTRRVAHRAWRDLRKARARCAPTISKPMDFDGVMIDVEVTQAIRGLPRYHGSRGFSNHQKVSTVIKGGSQGMEIYVDGYSAYRRVRNSILRVQFAHYDQDSLASVTLPPKYLRFTRHEARVIVDRLAGMGRG